MTDLRKAAEMLMKALDDGWVERGDNVAIALRQALAQPEQEPVAWMYVNEDDECEQIEYGKLFDDPYVTLLYIAPPKREWVGLTDEERLSFIAFEPHPLMNRTSIIHAVEAKLKEKNNA